MDRLRLSVAALASILLLVPHGAAHAAEPTSRADETPIARTSSSARADAGFDWAVFGAQTLDVVLLRPMGVCAVLAGSAFFLVAAPFSAPSGNVGTSFDFLVRQPSGYTFERPLGDF